MEAFEAKRRSNTVLTNPHAPADSWKVNHQGSTTMLTTLHALACDPSFHKRLPGRKGWGHYAWQSSARIYFGDADACTFLRRFVTQHTCACMNLR
eukprot:1143456-Pelagomonas_calceolata.AAC.15